MKMRLLLLTLLASVLLSVGVRAAVLPDEVAELLPDELSGREEESILSAGGKVLLDELRGVLSSAVRASAQNAALMATVVLLCGTLENAGAGGGKKAIRCVPYVGVLALTALAGGSVTAMIGMGTETMRELHTISEILMPSVAATIAAGGGVTTASAWQVGTLFASERLMALIETLLLPLTYSFIGVAAANAMLQNGQLAGIAGGMKKLISWCLTAVATVFCGYLSISHALSGSADRTAVKATKTVIHAVPVVGNILSDAAESLLSGASALRGVIGTAGVLAVLLTVLAPVVRLLARYLFFKVAAGVCTVSGVKSLGGYVGDLGSAFGLVLGMTCTCAFLLLAALFVALTMVVT